MTSAETAGEGKQVMTTSHCRAISAPDGAQLAPASSNACAAPCSTSRTVKSKPLRNRLPASLAPTLPKPINPIFIVKTR
jgi:hypothetical protein